MYKVVNSDLWLSSELQTLYNETKNKDSRMEIRDSYLKFEESLTDREICGYINKKICISGLNGSSCWKASEAISQGELLISENATCWDIIHVNRNSDDTTLCVWKQLITKCEKSKKLRLRIKDMFPRNQTDINKIKTESYYCRIPYSKIKEFYEESGELFKHVKLNEALRLYLVVKFNQMSMNMLPELWKTTFKWSKSFNVNGLFLNSSYFDHSCDPNVVRFYIGTMAVFRASRNIFPNEILSISYIENEHMYDPLWVRYCELNFWCLCDKCAHEIRDNSPNLSINEAIRVSKKNNPRYTLFDTHSFISLRRLNIKERITLSEEMLRNHFVSVPKDSPRLVFNDASKIISGLIFDNIHSRNFERAIHWIKFLLENNKFNDETVIPLYLLLGVLVRKTKQNQREANLCFQKAIKVFKTIFGKDNIKFFMKRYWGDVRFAIKGSNYFIKDRSFFLELKKVSSLLRTIFLS